MRGRIHDLLRVWIGINSVLIGALLSIVHRWRVRRFPRAQSLLRAQYGIEDITPIQTFGAEVEAAVAAFAARTGARFAQTSGSTATPKRIAYPKRRVRMVKLLYMDCFLRFYASRSIRRKSLYVFSALVEDGSLTGIMLEEKQLVPFLSGLQAPYRVQAHPAMQDLVSTYGTAAVRLFVLVIANPGVWYATNPSTLAQFLDAVINDWIRTSALCRDFFGDPSRFDPTVRRIRRRIDSLGATERLALAAGAVPPSIETLFSGLEAYCCWDGGYVRPFLDRVRRHLAPDRYRHVPMYSMSTETVETIADFSTDEVRFLPLAPGVLYELLPEGSADDPRALIAPAKAEIGQHYTLVVSDPYGLLRYQTGDVFECVARVGELPDLRFARRRGLEHSFTGEKITGAQLQEAYRTLDEQSFLTCVPRAEPEPHYELVVLGKKTSTDLAARFDAALSAINEEYRSKRKSGRLAPPRATVTDLASFVKRVGGGADWESQFKLLPLHREV